MFLSGPSPTFATLALKLAGQAAKGIKDNVNHYNKRQRGGALLTVVKNAAKIGYKLGKAKRYKRMGAKGVTGSCNRHRQLHRGKYDSFTQTTPFLGGYSERGQSKQETEDVRTC